MMLAHHNRPPPDADPLRQRLDEDHAALIDRKAALLAAEARLPDSLTEDTVGRVTDFARQIKACIKAAAETHKAEKAPFLEAGRTVDAWLASLRDPLAELVARVERRIGAFLQAKEAAARKAREEEARRLAAEARALAKEGDKAQAKEVRAEAKEVREEARTAAPADLVRTHTGMGGVATLKAPWTFEIKDRAAIDLEQLRPYLPADALDKAIRAYIRAGGRELAGVKIYQDRKASIR